MKDTKKILRHAIFNALDGQITLNSNPVPVFDEKIIEADYSGVAILLTNQSERAVERNSTAFITSSSIDLEIIQKTGTEVSKDDIDDIYESIIDIIFPSVLTIGITVPSGFQFQEGYRESSDTLGVQIEGTETIISLRTRFVFTITEQ